LKHILRLVEPTVEMSDMTVLLCKSSKTYLWYSDAVEGRSHHKSQRQEFARSPTAQFLDK
jgi:hypothetical protein